MRSIERTSAKPPTLRPTGAGGGLAASHFASRTASPTATLSFPEHWNKADVRGVLYARQWRVCAYCNRLLPGNDRGDVEHFRPKKKISGDPQHGGYWWLAYRLSNYVLSCGICNRTRKGARFPLRPQATRLTFERRQQLAREARLLTDPTRDPLDLWFTVDINDSLVRVGPKAGLTPTQKLQVESTISFFRLNTDRFLIADRLIALDFVTSSLSDGDNELARSMAIRFSPHSLVARTVLEQINPNLLPTIQHELDWLMDRVLSELDQLLEILSVSPNDSRSKIELDETYWCLAALLKNSTAGNVNRVRKIYLDNGILDTLQPLADQL